MIFNSTIQKYEKNRKRPMSLIIRIIIMRITRSGMLPHTQEGCCHYNKDTHTQEGPLCPGMAK